MGREETTEGISKGSTNGRKTRKASVSRKLRNKRRANEDRKSRDRRRVSASRKLKNKRRANGRRKCECGGKPKHEFLCERTKESEHCGLPGRKVGQEKGTARNRKGNRKCEVQAEHEKAKRGRKLLGRKRREEKAAAGRNEVLEGNGREKERVGWRK